jgi:hypothetical protein
MPATIGQPGARCLARDPRPPRPPPAPQSPDHRFRRIRPPAAAPAFTTTAVVDGEFKTVSLSDYKGR